jgi:hypothetical protein
MKPLARVFVLASLICVNGNTCLAQQPSGPATLENLLKPDEAQQPAAVPAAEANVTGPKRTAGIVTRPKDGVQHPDLDKAWVDYEAAVAKVGEGIRAAIAKQFDAAATKGDLDAAEKWQKAQERFESSGEVPAETDLKSAVSSSVADYKRAKDELTKAYDALVKSLTMEKNIVQAKVVRDEMRRLSESRPAPVPSPKPVAHSVEGVWRWGRHAMVFYPNGTAKEFFPDKGGNPLGGRWNAAAEKEVNLRLDNGYVVACALAGGDSMVASCQSPEGRKHEVLAKKVTKTSSLWRWFNGGFVELCGDGCVNGNPEGRWRKDGGRMIITWPAGAIDTLAVSPDGSRLNGTNQHGLQVSGELIR